MLVTVSNPEQKDLTEKQLVSLAIKMFKNTLNTWVSTHLFNEDYSISIDQSTEETNSCYIDLYNVYIRTDLTLKSFKRIIKKQFNLLFNYLKDESIN